MNEATFTIRIDQGLKDQFISAARAKDRSSAQLVRDFMRAYVRQQQEVIEHDAWFQRQVQIGLDSANAGDLISAEEIEADAQAWKAAIEMSNSGDRIVPMKPLAFCACLAVLMEPTAALTATRPSVPPKHGFPKVGTCYLSRITAVEGRLGASPVSGSGSQVEFRNGVIQTSYDVVRPIVRSRVGDKVTMCVIELPKHCPPNDFRGVVYRTHNWRTKENWTLSNSEHGCGGA